MAEKTLAVIAGGHATGRLGITEIAEPGPGDVVIKTRLSGISTGTDRWILQGRFGQNPFRYPLIPGYQRTGIIQWVGHDVTHLKAGQLVAATRSLNMADYPTSWGGHVGLGITPASEVFPLGSTPEAAAALFVSAQVGVNAASRLTGDTSRRVLVLGDGIIGASAALASKIRGFDVVAAGHKSERLGHLARLGITTLNTSTAGDLADVTPDAVIDTVQSDASVASYLEHLPERTGQIVFSGHPPDNITTWGNHARLQQRELTLHYVSGWTRDRLEHTLTLMQSGALPIEELIDSRAEGQKEATDLVNAVASGTSRALGAVIDWNTFI